MSRLVDLLELSHVPRWTTHPVARQQTVADHSFRVAAIARDIAAGFDLMNEDLLAILLWALDHDAPESKLSDMPAPVHALIERTFSAGSFRKLEDAACSWFDGARPEAGSLVDQIVKVADVIEALSWVTIYGTGMKDKFDGRTIEYKLRARLEGLLEKYGNARLTTVVGQVVKEMGI